MKTFLSRNTGALRVFFIAVALQPSVPTPAMGYVLDWGVESWTAGNTTGTLMDVQSSGFDIKISITGDLEFSGTSPSIQASKFPGAALELAMDWDDDFDRPPPVIGDQVNILIEFLATGTTDAIQVQNVSYSIYDVDFSNSGGSNFRDMLIGFRGIDDVDMDADIAPTLSNVGAGATNTITNGGPSIGLPRAVGNATNTDSLSPGNVDITFGVTDTITSIDFNYLPGSVVGNDPTQQWIGIGNLSFTPVPETGTDLALCVFAFGAITVSQCHRRKRRSATPAL
jgi:hypothetical protein